MSANTDRTFERISLVCAIGVVAVVFLIGSVLLWESSPVFQKLGWRLLTNSQWDPVGEEFGLVPFIYGTLVSALLALLFAIPFSLGIAIFLTELSPDWLRGPTAFLIELLAAIPSVIYGLWGIFYLAPWLRQSVEPLLIQLNLPLFRGPAYGIGMLAAGIILAIMIIPIIASIARDVFQAVPMHQREAALALGATRWEVTRLAVLKYSESGILGAIFLGLGRALGETMAVTMVIGNRPEISLSLLAPSHTMASVLANEFAEASGALHLSALAAIGISLFVITFLTNAAARFLVWKVSGVAVAGRRE